MHYRNALRDLLKARATSLPGQTSAPFDSIAQAIDAAKLPAAVVTFQDEVADPPEIFENGEEAQRRTLAARFVLVALRPDDLEKMAEALEVRMAATLGVGVLCQLLATRFQDPARGERDFFSLALDYSIRFSLYTTDPSRVAV
jgi:hypothetical protein